MTARVCDVGPCHAIAVVQFTGESGRSWRTARACGGHAQMLADYVGKPIEEWRDDYTVVAEYDHARRRWVPVTEETT